MTSLEIYEILALVQKFAQKEKIECFLVGGYLRDQELNRKTKDLDFPISSDPKKIAEKVSKELKSSFFALKEEREIYRMVLDNGLQLDFARFKGATIEEDLSLRGFSINALAKNMEQGNTLMDPYEGKRDIKEKKERQIHENIFEEQGLDSHPMATSMKMGTLLHDVGKAPTAKIVNGRLRFYEHQNIGAKITSLISQRLRFSFNASRHLSQMVLSHMRPGGLAHAPTLSDKAKFRFF